MARVLNLEGCQTEAQGWVLQGPGLQCHAIGTRRRMAYSKRARRNGDPDHAVWFFHCNLLRLRPFLARGMSRTWG